MILRQLLAFQLLFLAGGLAAQTTLAPSATPRAARVLSLSSDASDKICPNQCTVKVVATSYASTAGFSRCKVEIDTGTLSVGKKEKNRVIEWTLSGASTDPQKPADHDYFFLPYTGVKFLDEHDENDFEVEGNPEAAELTVFKWKSKNLRAKEFQYEVAVYRKKKGTFEKWTLCDLNDPKVVNTGQ
jgi:hypothetical protein